MANILGFAGIGVSGLTLLFAILAIALNKWETTEILTIEYSIGLWEVCAAASGNELCIKVEDSSLITDDDLNNVRAVRATLLLGILLTTGAIVTAILVLFVLTTKKILFFVAGGLDIAAGFFLMVAMAVYAGKLDKEGYDYNACFALDIIAWIAAWAGGGIFVGAKFLDKE